MIAFITPQHTIAYCGTLISYNIVSSNMSYIAITHRLNPGHFVHQELLT